MRPGILFFRPIYQSVSLGISHYFQFAFQYYFKEGEIGKGSVVKNSLKTATDVIPTK